MSLFEVKPLVLRLRKPDAVPRLIMTVVIEAVDFVAGRRIAHVGEEGFKAWVARLDRACTVARIGGICWVTAAA
jgi:hypothetical protein